MSIGKNIARFRRERGWTQAELGEILGVSNQAVSKWESEVSMPDVMLLPGMADAFGCYIDELFSRHVENEIHYDHCASLPWNDDEVLRCIVCEGKKILQVTEGPAREVTFRIVGNSKAITCDANITVEGNVVGGCTCRGNISAGGSITGECTAEGSIESGEWIMGACTAGGSITAGGHITGECFARGDVISGGASSEEAPL